jgi:TLD
MSSVVPEQDNPLVTNATPATRFEGPDLINMTEPATLVAAPVSIVHDQHTHAPQDSSNGHQVTGANENEQATRSPHGSTRHSTEAASVDDSKTTVSATTTTSTSATAGDEKFTQSRSRARTHSDTGSVNTESGELMDKAEIQHRLQRLEMLMHNLMVEEKAVKSQSTTLESRQQTLFRTRRSLDAKLKGLDRNRTMLANRLNDMDQRMNDAESNKKSQMMEKTDIIRSIEEMKARQEALSVNIESNEEEMRRSFKAVLGQEREFNELIARQQHLGKERAKYTYQLEAERKELAAIEHKLKDAQDQSSLISTALASPSSSSTQPSAAPSRDNIHLTQQQQQLQTKCSKFDAHIEKLKSTIETLEAQLSETTQEQKEISGLLPTLKDTHREMKALYEKHKAKDANMKREARRLVVGVQSAYDNIKKVDEAIVAGEKRIESMTTMRRSVQFEVSTLKQSSDKITTRIADVQSGIDALAASIRANTQHNAHLRQRYEKFAQQKAQIAAASHLFKPHPPAGPPPVALQKKQPRRGASGATAVNLTCYSGDKDADGLLTITSFLVIFEPSQQTEPGLISTFLFCFDMQDVSACKLVQAPLTERQRVPPKKRPGIIPLLAMTFGGGSKDSSTRRRSRNKQSGSSDSQLQLQLSLRETSSNRFLFNKDAPSASTHGDLGSNLYFSGTQEDLKSAYSALHEALLVHEERAKHEAQFSSSGILVVPSAELAGDQAAGSASTTDGVTPDSATSGGMSGAEFNGILEIEQLQGESELLSKEMLRQALQGIPLRLQLEKWSRLYSMTEHGANLRNFKHMCGRAQCSLLIFRDSKGTVFGGFASEPWTDSALYYGTGESYVFRLETSASGSEKMTLYKWSGKNTHLLLCNENHIAMGGG